MRKELDLILVGAGLSNLWIALEVRRQFPDLSFAILEHSPRFLGRQTWSFQESDIPAAILPRLLPFVTERWNDYTVRFPELSKELRSKYASIRSETFFRRASAILGDSVFFNQTVSAIDSSGVHTGSDCFQGRVILDGRGIGKQNPDFKRGYQCFFGIEVELDRPHGCSSPILMDATVEQRDGFRFVYVLPYSPTTLLIEDTRYTETIPQEWSDYRSGIAEYAKARGWRVVREIREESGALPIPLWPEDMVPVDANRGRLHSVSDVGVRGGFYHPTTGYSVPDAVRLAEAIVSVGIGEQTHPAIDAFRASRARRPYCMLNRMLYLGANPADRYRLLEGFYRLPAGTVERFYRSEMRLRDWLRLFVGRIPPIEIGLALKCILAQPGKTKRWQRAWVGSVSQL